MKIVTNVAKNLEYIGTLLNFEQITERCSHKTTFIDLV